MKVLSLCLAILIAVAGLFYWRDIVSRRQAMAIMYNRAELRALAYEIDVNAGLQHELFLQAIGTGLVTDAMSLGTVNSHLKVEHIMDTFVQHPFHVKLSRKEGVSTNGDGLRVYLYDLLVWSDGPNGTNEFGNGDDLSFARRIQCPILTP